MAMLATAMVIASWAGPTGPSARADVNTEPQPMQYEVIQQRPDRLLVKLPNRMIVVVQRVEAAPVVSVQMAVRTGSIYEQEFVGAGLSHYLEHMLSGGSTTTRTEAESNRILSRIGAQTNASTGLDTVRYYINTTSDHVDTAVGLVSDWMQNAIIDEGEFQREREVIQSEFAMGRGDPNRLLWRLTQQARFRHHPARHPTIGYLDEFEQITREQLVDFYQRMYVPNNMVMAVVGDVDKQSVVERIADLWAEVPAGELPEIAFPREPKLDAPHQLEGKAGIRATRVRLAFPGTRLGDEHDFALDLLAGVLGDGEASRLVQTVRDEQGVVNTISAYNLSFHWGEGFFGIDAEVPAAADGAGNTAQLEKVREAILEQLRKVRDEPVSEADLDRARRQVLGRIVYGAQTAQRIATRLTSDILATGDPDYLQHYVDALEQVTPEQVQAAAESVLDEQRLISVVLRPLGPGEQAEEMQREDQREQPDLAHEPVELDNAHLRDRLHESTAGESAVEAAEFDPIERFELDNGLRVIVQRSTLAPAVAVDLYQLGGLLADEPGREGLANATAAMQKRGTQNRDARQVASELAALGAQLSISSGYNTHYATAVCLRDDLPAVMDLMADVTLRPTFPEDEWSNVQRRLLAAIDREQDRWVGELSRHFREAYYGDHPWSQTPIGRREAVAAFTVEDLRHFHRDHLGAEEAVLAIFGDVSLEQAKMLAERHFGDMPRQAPGLKLAGDPEPPGSTAQQVKTRKDRVAAAFIGLGPMPRRDEADYAAMSVLGTILSRFPSGSLTEALRKEGPGLAYAVWAFQQTGLRPGHFAVVFNSTHETAPEALRRSVRVLDHIIDQPVDEDELEEARATVLVRESLSRQSNSQRAGDAALDALYGLGDDATERFLKQVEALDADTLHEATRRYLANRIIVLMTDAPMPDELFDRAVSGVAQSLLNDEAATRTDPTPVAD